MAIDLTSILLGLAGAALPLLALAWQIQRRASAGQADVALLEERLAMAQLAQDGLNAQLDACRDEIGDLSQANSTKQADLAALRREVELLQIERDDARDAAHAWNIERAGKEAELRRLDAQAASSTPSCANNRKAISNASTTSRARAMNCGRSSPNWRARSSTSASSVSPKPVSSAWGSCSIR